MPRNKITEAESLNPKDPIFTSLSVEEAEDYLDAAKKEAQKLNAKLGELKRQNQATSGETKRRSTTMFYTLRGVKNPAQIISKEIKEIAKRVASLNELQKILSDQVNRTKQMLKEEQITQRMAALEALIERDRQYLNSTAVEPGYSSFVRDRTVAIQDCRSFIKALEDLHAQLPTRKITLDLQTIKDTLDRKEFAYNDPLVKVLLEPGNHMLLDDFLLRVQQFRSLANGHGKQFTANDLALLDSIEEKMNSVVIKRDVLEMELPDAIADYIKTLETSENRNDPDIIEKHESARKQFKDSFSALAEIENIVNAEKSKEFYGVSQGLGFRPGLVEVDSMQKLLEKFTKIGQPRASASHARKI